MRHLGAPAWVAALCAALALLVHPGVPAQRLPWWGTALAALALLLAASVASRARQGAAELLAALGMVTFVLALGYDALRGHAGSVTLAPGASTRTFDEQGPGGKGLGLRPLGFTLTLGALDAAGPAELLAASDAARARLRVGASRAVAFGGFRLGGPRVVATGEAARLGLLLARGGEERAVEVVPGATARSGDLTVELERYFPDFALDAKNEPYTRSAEPVNPAALLQVRRGTQAWRVFVIRAMPGIHQLPGLDWTFSLRSVEPAVALTLRVAREPAAGLAAAGALLLALGLTQGLARP